MKHLKSTSQDLRELFTQAVTVRHISEPLASFDTEAASSTVLRFMEERDYDVVGVRRDGLVVGYVERASLRGAETAQACKPFDQDCLIDDSASLLEALSAMGRSPRLFVSVLGSVGGIVTRGDLQKAPVRMWLFGLVSLIEMQLLRLVRGAYPDNSWKPVISSRRLGLAQQVLQDRKRSNTNVDLADCLQLCDKRDIVTSNDQLLSKIGPSSSEEVEHFLRALEVLRNDLAHAQDIVTDRWPDIIDLAQQAEDWLRRCEDVTL